MIEQVLDKLEEYGVSKEKTKEIRDEFSIEKQVFSVIQCFSYLSEWQMKKLGAIYQVWKNHHLDGPTSIEILFNILYESIVRYIGVENIFNSDNVVGFLGNEFGQKFIPYAMGKRLEALKKFNLYSDESFKSFPFASFESFIKDLDLLVRDKQMIALNQATIIQAHYDAAIRSYADSCQRLRDKDEFLFPHKACVHFAQFVFCELPSGNQGVAFETLNQLAIRTIGAFQYQPFIDNLIKQIEDYEEHKQHELNQLIVSTLSLMLPKVTLRPYRNHLIDYANSLKTKRQFTPEEISILDAAVEKVVRNELREKKAEIEKLVVKIDAAITVFESSTYLQRNLKCLEGDVGYQESLEIIEDFKSGIKSMHNEANALNPETAEINGLKSIYYSESIQDKLRKKFSKFKENYKSVQEQIAYAISEGEEKNQKRFAILQKAHKDVLSEAERKMQALYSSAEGSWKIRKTLDFSEFKLDEVSHQAFLAHEKTLSKPLKLIRIAFGEMALSLEKNKNEFEAQTQEIKTCLDDTALTLVEQAAKITEFAQKWEAVKLSIEVETKKHSEILEKLTTEAKHVLAIKVDDVKKEFKHQIGIREGREKALTNIQGVIQGLPSLIGQMLPQVEHILTTAQKEFESKEGERDRAKVLLWLFDNRIFSWLPFVAPLRKFREEQQKLEQYTERLAALKSKVEPLQTPSVLQVDAIIGLNQSLLGDMHYFDDRVTQLPTLNTRLQVLESASDILKNASTLQTQMLDTALAEVKDELTQLREAEERFADTFAEQQYQNQLAEYRLKAKTDKVSPLAWVVNDSDMSIETKKRYLTDLIMGDEKKGENGYYVNQNSESGKTPLKLAIKQGSLETVQFLVEKGATVNPIGNFILCPEIVRNLSKKRPYIERTPLFSAFAANQPEIVHYIREKGAYDEGLDLTSLLMTRLKEGNFSAVKFLLSQKPAYFSRPFTESEKNALLHLAIQSEDDPILVERLLDEGASIKPIESKEKNTKGNNPLHIAAQNGRVKVIEALLKRKLWNAVPINAQNDVGNTALHVAINYGQFDVAEQLIDAGAVANLCNSSTGNTPLHLIAKAGTDRDFKLLQVWINKQKSDYFNETVQILNIKNAKDNTALHLAMQGNNLKLVDLLIENGADVHAKNKAGEEPFETAEGEEILKQIIKDAKDNAAPDRAYGKLYAYLDRQGIVENYNRRIKEKTPVMEAPLPVSAQMLFTHYQALQSAQLSAETQEETHQKANDKSSLSVKLILMENALRLTETELRDDRGNTILHALAAYNDHALAEFIKHYHAEQKQTWLQLLNATNHAGETALHIGVREKQVDIVKFLLAEGIDRDVSNKEEQTAWDIAFKANDVQMIALLQTQAKLDALLPTLDFNDEPPRQLWMDVLKKTPFKQQRALLNARDKQGNTLLHAAVQKKALKDVNLLTKEYRADVSIKNALGQSPSDLAKASQSEKMESLFVQFVSLFTDVESEEYTEGKIYKNIDAHASKYRGPIAVIKSMGLLLRGLREQYSIESYQVLTQIVEEKKREPLQVDLLERLQEKHAIIEKTLREMDGALAEGKILIETAKEAETLEAFIKGYETKIKRVKARLVAIQAPKQESVSATEDLGATETLTTDFKALRRKLNQQRAEGTLSILSDTSESATPLHSMEGKSHMYRSPLTQPYNRNSSKESAALLSEAPLSVAEDSEQIFAGNFLF